MAIAYNHRFEWRQKRYSAALFAWLISHQPASSIFPSEQTNHQQPASSTFISEQISTRYQPLAKRAGCASTVK
jgi:hypothetical protein